MKYIYSITVAIEPRDYHGVCASQFECGATLLREANLQILEPEMDTFLDKEDLIDILTEEIKEKITFFKPKPSKWRYLKTWWNKYEDYFSSFSYTTRIKYFKKSQSNSDTEFSWPESLKDSSVVETILDNPTIKKRLLKLSNDLLFDEGENSIQRKLEKLLKIAITSTFKHIKDSILQLTKDSSTILDNDEDDDELGLTDEDTIIYTYFPEE
jgi:hypothetical protein